MAEAPDSSSEISDRISELIMKLNKEIESLKEFQLKEIEGLKFKSEQGIEQLRAHFDSQLGELGLSYVQKIKGLEDEINYLQELSSSQRMMMDAKIEYIKALETKLIKGVE
jgi:hypothetical protein